MKHFTLLAALACILISENYPCNAQTPPVSEFDEGAIRAMQDSRELTPVLQPILQQLEASNDASIKAAKWEEAVIASSEGLLAAVWTVPSSGWNLLVFPSSGNLSLQDADDQPFQKAFYTKLVAQNETEAMRLRSAGALMFGAALQGEQWGEKLILDIAQRPDSNIKWLTYWYTKHFAQDWHTKGEAATGAPVWQVNWSGWQQAYNNANNLGKAIILRNVTMLAIRRNEVATAATINLSALSGTNRELKAIALAFGDPALGSNIAAKWAEIATNTSDLQMQFLAQEARKKFGLNN